MDHFFLSRIAHGQIDIPLKLVVQSGLIRVAFGSDAEDTTDNARFEFSRMGGEVRESQGGSWRR